MKRYDPPASKKMRKMLYPVHGVPEDESTLAASVSEARQHLHLMLDDCATGKVFVIIRHGQQQGVLLGVEAFKALKAK